MPGRARVRSFQVSRNVISGAERNIGKTRLHHMTETTPQVLENSFRIAWDYLEATGELGEAEPAAAFLLDTIEGMMRRGERRKLLLFNIAIDADKRRQGE